MTDDQLLSIGKLLPSLYKVVSGGEEVTRDLFFAKELQGRMLKHFVSKRDDPKVFLENITAQRVVLQDNNYVRNKGLVWLVYSDLYLHMWTPYNEKFISWLKAATPSSARSYQTSDKCWTLHLTSVDSDALVSHLKKYYQGVCCVVIDARDSLKQDIPRVCFL